LRKNGIIFFLIFFIFNCYSKEISSHFIYKTFEDAEVALGDKINYLRFLIESTNLGFIATDVEGFVMEFNVSANVTESIETVTEMAIKFKAKDMNTDNDLRNDKLHNFCLVHTKYPNVVVEIKDEYKLRSGKQMIPATIEVRGERKKIRVALEISKTGNDYLVEGKSLMKFSLLGLPDPSISISSVSDDIIVDFKVLVEGKKI